MYVLKRLFHRYIKADMPVAGDTDRRLLALLSLDDMIMRDRLRANAELRECILERLRLARGVAQLPPYLAEQWVGEQPCPSQ